MTAQKPFPFKKAELEHKQTEIIDSINYAQRIQRALLASDTVLTKHLRKYFVLFKPKDIVSGDFYWATTLNNGNFALVTADSTGHGVPGAIMSMLNISCLEKVTESEKLTEPNQILDSTRKKIIDTLANDGSEEGGKDGMDCSFISFDFLNNYLYIAAAYNPVWIIRQDTENPENTLKYSMLEIKADKMPAGKHDKQNIPFSLQKIQVFKSDLIYTLTDGYADQFGGPEGKKFMSKSLKALILQNAHLPLEEQYQLLNEAFEKWKQGFEQVDDVTLIGIQV